jgi:hypothetical protein
VLSENDAAVEKHHLHAIESVLKQDADHSTQLGAVAGIIGAATYSETYLCYEMAYNCSRVASFWISDSYCFGFLYLRRRFSQHSNV